MVQFVYCNLDSPIESRRNIRTPSSTHSSLFTPYEYPVNRAVFRHGFCFSSMLIQRIKILVLKDDDKTRPGT